MPNYNDMQLSKSTRATGDICYCYICQTARSTNHFKAVVGQGHARQFNTIIDHSNGLYGHSNFAAISNSDICKECLSEIDKGVTDSQVAASSTPTDSEYVLRERRHVGITDVEDDKHAARTHSRTGGVDRRRDH